MGQISLARLFVTPCWCGREDLCSHLHNDMSSCPKIGDVATPFSQLIAASYREQLDRI